MEQASCEKQDPDAQGDWRELVKQAVLLVVSSARSWDSLLSIPSLRLHEPLEAQMVLLSDCASQARSKDKGTFPGDQGKEKQEVTGDIVIANGLLKAASL